MAINRESLSVRSVFFRVFRVLFFSLLIPITGATMMTADANTNPASETEGVSRELARQRAARIYDLRYRLRIELAPGEARFRGRVEISLRLRDTASPVILDFRDLDDQGNVIDGRMRNPQVNSLSIDDLKQTNGHIVIPAHHFKSGENSIALDFDSAVAPAGRPVIRYLDRDDGSEYIYTLFVPMDASLAFPCFDQPDLKGRFSLEIAAPESWSVIANTPPEGALMHAVPDSRVEYRMTRFLQTPPISTYLLAFAAGPFAELAGSGPGAPLRLYVRRSKLDRAREEWPEVERLTRDGIGFLAKFFDHRFPFAKYDQVLIPGFAYGGMEHVGATFLREDAVLFRSTPTANDRMGRASLVLHELTHQWFGDFVTMRWFDDLWLKEGFATYMAYRAMAELLSPDDVWKRFSQTLKPAAYAIDATRGTTPIYQEVPNLKDAKSAYGAIVYQKAPAILHALAFTIGDAAFRDGVRIFLKEHAYANAEWNDLIRAFERASKTSLGPWADAWVRKRGMPQVDLNWKCTSAGKISRLEAQQRDVLNEGGLWPIRSQLLLAYKDGSVDTLTLSLDAAKTVVGEAAGRRCPAYVFANDGDYGYGRFSLDAHSRKTVTDLLARPDAVIGNSLRRALLWSALWEAVREAKMAPVDFVELTAGALARESDEDLTLVLLGRATTAFQRYLSDAQRNRTAPLLERLCLERMQNAESLGLRITYFRAFRALATTAEGRNNLKRLLAGKLNIEGLTLQPLDRWQTVRALLVAGDEEAEALLEGERRRDTSDDGRKQSYLTEAGRADAATKKRYFDDYLRNRNVPEDWVEGSLAGFNAWNQSALTRAYLEPALAALPQMKRERKIFFVLAWLNSFIGGQRDASALAAVREFLRTHTLDRDLQLKVLEVMDELERTVKIRGTFSAK